jgi:hypothetical protein
LKERGPVVVLHFGQVLIPRGIKIFPYLSFILAKLIAGEKQKEMPELLSIALRL